MKNAKDSELPKVPEGIKIGAALYDYSEKAWEKKQIMFMSNRLATYKKGSLELETGIWYYKLEECKIEEVSGDYDGLGDKVGSDFSMPDPICCFKYKNLWTKYHTSKSYICSIKDDVD